jgi:hypothetical protein
MFSLLLIFLLNLAYGKRLRGWSDRLRSLDEDLNSLRIYPRYRNASQILQFNLRLASTIAVTVLDTYR